ncbi:glycosyl hydrolase family 28 protein [Nibricoccus sp. IMCC34717]|uniref:glycosyl hydrolase family 28 protein n=1 Tax=Nibricoccus sp. IMCC34717 TaxID=3034021 RepID=UPI00384F05E7
MAASAPYRYSSGVPHSTQFSVRVDGVAHEVIHTTAGDFVRFESATASRVEITCSGEPRGVIVRPLRLGVKGAVAGRVASFELPAGVAIMVDLEGQPSLFVFSDLPEKEVPKPGTPGLLFFEAGRLYDAGEIRLEKGQQLYLQAGSVVRGSIRATQADGIRIFGRGVLDGTLSHRAGEFRRLIVIEDSANVSLEDICMIEPTTWMTVLGACRDSRISGLRELGDVLSSDGIDLNGCQRITVEDCFLRNGDDCIAIKSLDLSAHDKTVRLDHTRDVADILVRRCAVISYRGGGGLEIGHELRTPSVKRIRFEDCDILGIHGFGAAISIHNGDRAVVSDVIYRNIRIEHYYDKLIDFRVIQSRYSQDEQRGVVRDILLRDVAVTVSEFNPGYTPSVIGGWDEGHLVSGVRFENFTMNGVPVTLPREIDLFTRFAEGIEFVVLKR